MLTLPAANEISGRRKGVIPAGKSRAGVIDMGRCNHCTQTTAIHYTGNFIGIKIHVNKRSRAAANHFPAGQLGTGAHEVRCNKATFHREYIVVEPAHKFQIVHHASEQGHGAVSMAIDQAGHEYASGATYRLFCHILPVDLSSRAHRNDPVGGHHDRAIFEHRLIGLHGQYIVTVGNQVRRAVFIGGQGG